MIEAIVLPILWQIFIWSSKFIARLKLCNDELSKLVMFDVMPRNEYARVYLGSDPKFELYFHITNLSPVDIELDRAEIEFVCAGVGLKSIYIKRMTIKPSKTKLIYISEHINSSDVSNIAQNYKNNKSHISATLEFNCKIHNFTKHVPALQGVKPEFINMPE